MYVSIDQLHLRWMDVSGQEHRVRPITQRALELLHQRLNNQLLTSAMRLEDLNLSRLILPPMAINFRVLTDEGAAEKLADAMYSALLARWQEG